MSGDETVAGEGDGPQVSSEKKDRGAPTVELGENNVLNLTDEQLNDAYQEIGKEELKQVLEETRPAIDGHADTLSDIDDKAVRTLRLNILVFGFLLTFASLVTKSSGGQFEALSQYVNIPYGVGLASSGISATLALITFTQSEVRSGFATENVTSVFRDKAEKNVMNNKVLLFNRVLSHVSWIQNNRSVNRRDARMLFASHMFLMTSVGNYTLAVVLAGLGITGLCSSLLLSIVSSLLLAVIISLPKTVLWPILSGAWKEIDEKVLEEIRGK